MPRPLVTILTLVLSVPAVGLAGQAHAKGAAKKPAEKPAVAAKDAPASDKSAPVAAKDAPAKGEAKGEAPAGASATPPSGSPMAELKKSNDKLDKVLHKNAPNWSPEAELERTEVRKIVGDFLDYDELARRSLGRHWDGLTPKQRTEFTNTLRELVERSYLKQIHGSPNYNIKYEKEAKNGNEATVDATLNTTSRGKKVQIALQYKMIGKNGKWVVYDVVTDEQSMLENYRAEFNKIISKEGFDALMKRMQKKLAEKE
jgi:phospholipid transport system substrate-binding protein